jgi:serine/threonine-protein phosphatase PGAM5
MKRPPLSSAMWMLVLASLLCAGAARAADAPRPAGAPKPPDGVRYLYLVRHGMYDRDDRADDRVGNGLNVLGHEQARRTGEWLAHLPVKMDRLVSSDYTRARQTADDIGNVLGLTPERDSLIHECTPGPRRDDARRDTTMRGADAEEAAACEANLQAAWDKYARPSPQADERDVLVCHGNVIRWLACRALGADTRSWRSMDIANGSITVIAVRADGSTRLVSFSEVGHLPLDEQTWVGRGPGWVPRKTP